MPIYELEDVRSLPPRERSWVPSREHRQAARVGDSVRLLVIVDGLYAEHPWVEITAILPPEPPRTLAQYVGITRQAYGGFGTKEPIPENTEFNFIIDNIIEF